MYAIAQQYLEPMEFVIVLAASNLEKYKYVRPGSGFLITFYFDTQDNSLWVVDLCAPDQQMVGHRRNINYEKIRSMERPINVQGLHRHASPVDFALAWWQKNQWRQKK